MIDSDQTLTAYIDTELSSVSGHYRKCGSS